MIADPPFTLLQPARQTAAVVLTSPHSGRRYDAAFLAQARLDAQSLRRSEDSFVEELFAAGPSLGVSLLAAEFPRAWCDANREPWELDPAMFADALPDYANTTSPRVAAGLGTVARIVGAGEPIYGKKLRFAEAKPRRASIRVGVRFMRRWRSALRIRWRVSAIAWCLIVIPCPPRLAA